MQTRTHTRTHTFMHTQAAFLTALSNELADVNKSEVARMASGLQLKNYLTSKAPEVKLQYQQAWLSFDPAIRSHIKAMVSSEEPI